MRRLRLLFLFFALAAPAVLAAEEKAAEGEHGASHEMLWRVVNFAILAGLLGWVAKKFKIGAFFASRSDAIQKDIAESKRLLLDASERARAIELRLAGLDRDIREMRANATAEMVAEHERLERQAEQRVRKVFALAEQEMAAAAKAARQELKSYAASLAVELAEKKIAGKITPQVQRGLVGGFVRSLGR